MSIKRLIVEIDTSQVNVRRFCADHGVSKTTFYDLRKAYAERGEAALEANSRAPRRIANRTSGDVEDRIVGLRKDLVELGVDAGPATIRTHLCRELGEGVACPSEATIWRILHRRGFIVAQPAKAPKRAMRRFAADRANEMWQLDDTTWVLPDGTEAKIINVIDDCTRVCPASQAEHRCTTARAFAALGAGAHQWGWPSRLLTDNAREFEALRAALGAIGVELVHSRPYHPQTCGKVERFHQTLKRFLAYHQPENLTELQGCLDRFRDYYNHQRPHRAIARRTPAEVWHTTPKSGPATTALRIDQPPETTTWNTTVHADGRVNLGRRYRISLGVAWAHQPVTVVLTGTNCHVFNDGTVIRQLSINPDSRHQPLHDRPGRPTTR